MIYLITFSFSTFFTFIAEHTRRNKGLFLLYSLIAILFPSLLAGFRDRGIGTDTIGYVDIVWEQVRMIHNWNDFLIAYQNGFFI